MPGKDTVIIVVANNSLQGFVYPDSFTTFDLKGNNNEVFLRASDEKGSQKGKYYTLISYGDKNELKGGVRINKKIHAIGNKNELYGWGGDDYLTVIGQENKAYGWDGEDVLIGTGDRNILNGGKNKDWLRVTGNVNKCEGWEGDDVLIAEGIVNELKGQGGNDRMSAQGYSNKLEGGIGDDILTVKGNFNVLSGESGTDYLSVQGYRNCLDGGGDDDQLMVTGNGNRLYGRYGADISVAIGNDNRSYGGDNDDELYAKGTGNKSFGGQGNDSLSAHGNRNGLYGGAGDDTLTATGNNNCLRGGIGNDRLYAHGDGNILDGGAGDNTLVGGSGNDIFLLDPNVIAKQTLVDFNPEEDRLVIVWNQKNKRAHFPEIHWQKSSDSISAQCVIQIGKTELVFTQDVLGRKIVFDVVDSQAMKTVKQTIADAMGYKVVSYVPTVPMGKGALSPCYPLSQRYCFNPNDQTVSHVAPFFVEDFEVDVKDKVRIRVRTDEKGNIVSQHPLTIGDFFVDQKSAVTSLSPEVKDASVSDIEKIFLYCLNDYGLRFNPKEEHRDVDQHYGLTRDKWDNQAHAISVGDLNAQHVRPVGFSSVDSAQVRIAVGLKNGCITPFSMRTTNIMFVEE